VTDRSFGAAAPRRESFRIRYSTNGCSVLIVSSVSHGTVDHGTYPECLCILKFTTVMDGVSLFVTSIRFTMGVILIVIGGVAAHGRNKGRTSKPTVTRVLQLTKCLKGVRREYCRILSREDNILQNTECDTRQTESRHTLQFDGADGK
jgi:hypothetical protein